MINCHRPQGLLSTTKFDIWPHTFTQIFQSTGIYGGALYGVNLVQYSGPSVSMGYLLQDTTTTPVDNKFHVSMRPGTRLWTIPSPQEVTHNLLSSSEDSWKQPEVSRANQKLLQLVPGGLLRPFSSGLGIHGC